MSALRAAGRGCRTEASEEGTWSLISAGVEPVESVGFPSFLGVGGFVVMMVPVVLVVSLVPVVGVGVVVTAVAGGVVPAGLVVPKGVVGRLVVPVVVPVFKGVWARVAPNPVLVAPVVVVPVVVAVRVVFVLADMVWVS
jgi:hypothetical protein